MIDAIALTRRCCVLTTLFQRKKISKAEYDQGIESLPVPDDLTLWLKEA